MSSITAAGWVLCEKIYTFLLFCASSSNTLPDSTMFFTMPARSTQIFLGMHKYVCACKCFTAFLSGWVMHVNMCTRRQGGSTCAQDTDVFPRWDGRPERRGGREGRKMAGEQLQSLRRQCVQQWCSEAARSPGFPSVKPLWPESGLYQVLSNQSKHWKHPLIQGSIH